MPDVNVAFHFVDVFTPRPLGGNQLCVVPDAGELDDGEMQAIAKEIGFSETTFVTEAAGDRYAMRIFTPGRELPFAGHPTLGTAFVLVSEGRSTPPRVTPRRDPFRGYFETSTFGTNCPPSSGRSSPTAT